MSSLIDKTCAACGRLDGSSVVCPCGHMYYCSIGCLVGDRARHAPACADLGRVPTDGVVAVDQAGRGRGLAAARPFGAGNPVMLISALPRPIPADRKHLDLRYWIGAASASQDGKLQTLTDLHYFSRGPGTGPAYLVNDLLPPEMIRELALAGTVAEVRAWLERRKKYVASNRPNVGMYFGNGYAAFTALRDIVPGEALYTEYSPQYWTGMIGLGLDGPDGAGSPASPRSRLASILHDAMGEYDPYVHIVDPVLLIPGPTIEDEIVLMNGCWNRQARRGKIEALSRLLSKPGFMEEHVVNRWLRLLGSTHTGWAAWAELFRAATVGA